MPNWVTNKLFISVDGLHEDDYPGIIDEIQEALKNDQGFIPTLIPAAPYEPEDEIVIGGEHVGYSLSDQRYDWCSENWGCKWGDCRTSFLYGPPASDYFVWTFDTAWAPPIAAIKTISGMDSARGTDVYMLSVEEQPSFRAHYHFKNGEVVTEVEENCFKILEWPKEPEGDDWNEPGTDDFEAHIKWNDCYERMNESLHAVVETIWGPEWALTLRGVMAESKAGEFAWGRA
ncbi:MAG: hypothetical protein CL489_03270 [Acidobacteria bacterium]|nr:hypothetical protein [Acidobacteriota bacterium]